MSKRLTEVLSGKAGNYILPFFWQHGEDAETLRKYMHVIQKSGIGAVCVESRPHPDYVGDKWWQDMDVILAEAERLHMKVWVLDDAHFPTGYCNGQIKEHPEYGKIYLEHYTVDVIGPMPQASFLIHLEEGERLLGVVAAKRKGTEVGELAEACDITDCVVDNWVYWSVPEGNWNVIIIKTTPHGSGRKDYCNLIDRQALKFFLDTVYEPHYAHYQDKFGSVFAGFFSDEPELGNTFGESGIGQPTMPLPWCGELEEKSVQVWGEERNIHLAALWSRIDGYFEKARYEYMNLVTDLYGTNFCGQVGEWCQNHGVEYIGHVIEDNGNHARTGYGTGHFYKALWGQHMSGIDVVLQQIRPGFEDRDFYHISGKNTYDGVFFHYGLAKLGSSLAVLDAKKKGRTMCELYGAYGWSEGLKLMKWIADHMLVRGVNWFVPHAFTPGSFPDPDCPPHFYAQGNNPQYPWFQDLMQYMNRMSHLLNGGSRRAKVAVLYTAELSWLGKCTPFEHIGRLLARQQIDYDVVPVGLLDTEAAGQYSILIIPECEKIPKELQRWIEYAKDRGIRILFAGSAPAVVESAWKQAEGFAAWRALKGADVSAEAETGEDRGTLQKEAAAVYCEGNHTRLLQELDEAGVREFITLGEQPFLRYYHYYHQDSEYYMFFNEAPNQLSDGVSAQRIETLLTFQTPFGKEEQLYWYRGWENKLEKAALSPDGGVFLSLAPNETILLCRSHEPGTLAAFCEEAMPVKECEKPYVLELNDNWSLALRSFDSPEYGKVQEIAQLENITGRAGKPDFSGNMCYRTEVYWDAEKYGSSAVLDCGQVYETLEVWVNEERQAVCIAPPYQCVIRNLHSGRNSIQLVVTNTLVHALKDTLSATMPVEPSGLLGPVRLLGRGSRKHQKTRKYR